MRLNAYGRFCVLHGRLPWHSHPGEGLPRDGLQGRRALQRLQRIYQVKVPGEDSRKMAICAMAEACYAASKRRSGVTSASVGEVSVHYGNSESSDKALQRQLYEKASVYLEISRGVGK